MALNMNWLNANRGTIVIVSTLTIISMAMMVFATIIPTQATTQVKITELVDSGIAAVEVRATAESALPAFAGLDGDLVSSAQAQDTSTLMPVAVTMADGTPAVRTEQGIFPCNSVIELGVTVGVGEIARNEIMRVCRL